MLFRLCELRDMDGHTSSGNKRRNMVKIGKWRKDWHGEMHNGVRVDMETPYGDLDPTKWVCHACYAYPLCLRKGQSTEAGTESRKRNAALAKAAKQKKGRGRPKKKNRIDADTATSDNKPPQTSDKGPFFHSRARTRRACVPASLFF